MSNKNRVTLNVIMTDARIMVRAPYLPRFPRAARAIKGADFDKPNKTWSFPEAALAEVKKLLMDFYGEDGTIAPSAIPRVNVLLNLETFAGARRGVFVLGRPVANRGRDGKFYLGPDVFHVGGTLPAEVNQQTPELIGYNTAVVCIHGVPKAFAEKECRNHPNGCMQIDKGQGAGDMLSAGKISGDLPNTKAELSALRNDLLSRLAEVQKKMNELDNKPEITGGLRDISDLLEADCPI